MQPLLDWLAAGGWSVAPQLDGQIHRFGDNNAQWFWGVQIHLQKDGAPYIVAVVGDWRTGAKHEFRSNGVCSYDDRKAIERRLKEGEERARKAKEIRQGEAACEAQALWEKLTEGITAYALAKKIDQPFGSRMGYDDRRTHFLAVPVRDIHGTLFGLQRIYDDGKKYFLAGQRIEGCFHQIGQLEDKIFLVEGWATGASVHLATGMPVACAFNAGNLEKVAKALRAANPGATIIVAGDDDRWLPADKGNPGREKAEAAAKACAGRAVFPFFNDTTTRPTDWNDLHCLEGLEAIAKQLQQLPAQRALQPDEIVSLPFPDQDPMTKNGEPGKRYSTLPNVRQLLKYLGITVRYNIIGKRMLVSIPGSSHSIDNEANANLAEITSACERCKIPTGHLPNYLLKIADENPYNPVASWIESEPWDGQTRLNDFYETIESTNEPLKEKLLRAWLISAIAAVYEPEGVSAHGVLVLRGKQYLGKTQWFKRLAPKELRILSDGMFLKPDDKDSVFQVVTSWLVELGELDATFRKADLAQLKAFLTRDKDIIRRPYAHFESEFARRTVFFGSVNETDYLKDPTGNRRFWTIDCKNIDYAHCVNMQQLWAEVRELYQAGEPWIPALDLVDQLNSHNEQFEEVDPIEERILAEFNWKDRYGQAWLNASQVCQAMGIENPTRRDTIPAARTLRKLTSEKERRVYTGQRQFLVPHHIKTP